MKKVNDIIRLIFNCGMEGFIFLGFLLLRLFFFINLLLLLNFGIDCFVWVINVVLMIVRIFVIVVVGIRWEMIEEVFVFKIFV